MDFIVQGFVQAFQLLMRGDKEVLSIALLTLKVSGTATLVSLVLGVPLGLYFAVSRFRGREFLVGAVNAGMGLPPTVVGLWVALFCGAEDRLAFSALCTHPQPWLSPSPLLPCP